MSDYLHSLMLGDQRLTGPVNPVLSNLRTIDESGTTGNESVAKMFARFGDMYHSVYGSTATVDHLQSWIRAHPYRKVHELKAVDIN